MLKTNDIKSKINANDQSTLFSTVPMIVFPIPIVKIDVNVDAGVTKLEGSSTAFPITI